MLAGVWSNTVIADYPVVAEAVTPAEPETVEENYPPVTHQWRATHVRQSQYCMQIVKCNDTSCCKPPRSSIFNLLKNRFMPIPRVVSTTGGLHCEKPGSISQQGHFASLPLCLIDLPLPDTGIAPNFDMYCPSLTVEQQKKRTCKSCLLYFPSAAAMNRHRVACCSTRRARPSASIESENIADPAAEDSDDSDSEFDLEEECNKATCIIEVQQDRSQALCVMEDAHLEFLPLELIERHRPELYQCYKEVAEQAQNSRDNGFPLIQNMDEWLTHPFVEAENSASG